MPGGGQCPGAPSGLDDDGGLTQGRDQTIARQEAVTAGPTARWHLGHESTGVDDGVQQIGIPRRVEAIHSPGAHGQRRAGAQGTAVGRRINAEGAAGDDHDAPRRQV